MQNRITQHLNPVAAYRRASVVGQALMTRTGASGTSSTSMMVAPSMGQPLPTWQAQLYRLAYESAVAEKTPLRRDPFTFSLN